MDRILGFTPKFLIHKSMANTPLGNNEAISVYLRCMLTEANVYRNFDAGTNRMLKDEEEQREMKNWMAE